MLFEHDHQSVHATSKALSSAASFTLDLLEARRLLSAVDLLEVGAHAAARGQAAKLGSVTLFSTYDRSAGQMLWATDGTQAGTRLVKDIDANESDPASWFISGRGNSIVFNGALYFTAVDNAHGRELWKSDGTTDGTTLVRDIVAGPADSDPEGFTILGDRLFFTANHQIFKTDGTTAGTEMVRDVDPLGFADAERMAVLDGNLYFTIYPQTDPYFGSNNTGQLWRTNGLPGGTEFVADINGQHDYTDSPGPAFDLINVNNTLYFTAGDALHGFELWKSDGTPQGTVMVADIAAGADSSSPAELTALGNTLAFAANGALWRTDGTATGTRQISAVTNPSDLAFVNDALYFTSDKGPYGRELWVTDGTNPGTHLVKDIRPEIDATPLDSSPDHLLPAAGHLFFRADDGTHGFELWHTDGTLAGTRLMADLETSGSSVAIPFGSAGARVLTAARELSTSRWLVYSIAIPAPSQPAAPKLKVGFDTGIFAGDRVTRTPRPEFTGTAMPGSLVRLFDNGVQIGHAFAAGNGNYDIAAASSLGEGRHTFTVTAADDEGQVSAPSSALSVRIDRQSPSITLADTSPRAIVLKFSENVRKSLALDDLRLVNTTTGRAVSRGTMDLVYNDLSNTATVTFPGLSGKSLPPAWYTLTVTNRDVTDVAGNSMPGASRFEFTTAPGISGSGSSKTLNLKGTRANDRIVLALKRGDAGVLQVSINDRITNYSMRLFSRLHIESLAGDDSISFNFADGAFKRPADIFAGAGNDTIQGGLGNDRIFAGAGDDVVSGGAGNDTIYGQAGNDVLSGETGNDYLNGGLGRDFLVGNKGSDRIIHDSQDDAQSDGNDTTVTS